MHKLEQALRDVQYLSRILGRSAPAGAAEALRIVLRMAETKREDIMLYAPVAMDKEFEDFSKDWPFEQRIAGAQTLKATQIIDLRHFVLGRLSRLEQSDREVLKDAYRLVLTECQKALSYLES